ncbi:hydroxyethylthiazole kinase [Butyrivibrio sp. INlla18]|uniref:hydroxyethylthiazole kinase n=1 Tax=Butyrivibrio sp. INlla18 TaxID=1520806 RepID=UPI000881B3A9|nr:hydroxyethylthiazole kinase [Butyrivibrio sp. INlla18]SDA47302.1 hydroxyethylthiazole kinase [Butyrivibrio sp. INlla18]
MEIIKKLKESNKLIHCITNPISMMQCANSVLGLGARPIMAEHPGEVIDITDSADALLINLGNITDVRMEAMRKSFETALYKGIPIVVDAVGVACSDIRKEFFYKKLITAMDCICTTQESKPFLVIKGNYSEIKALYDESYKGSGVDGDASLTEEDITSVARKLAKDLGVVILASGKTDIVTDGERTFTVTNGVKELGMITGTGCMLGAICASFLSAQEDIEAVAEACAFLGIAGERAAKEPVGSGTFLVKLLDEISLLTDEVLDELAKIIKE